MRDLRIISDGAVLVRDGVIEEIGPSRRVENLALAREAREIDVSGRVVMPGFVDCHTHLVYGGTTPAGLQVLRTSSVRRLEMRARGVMMAMVQHGTTTIEGRTGCVGNDADALKILRVLAALRGKPAEVVATYCAAHEVSPGFLAKLRRRKLARFVHLESPTGTALQVAGEAGFRVKIGGSGASAAAFGAVAVDQAEAATCADIAGLAQSDAVAVLLPAVGFHLASRFFARARAFIDGGAAVALGTGFDADNSPCTSMQMVVSLACSRMGMSPAEAICAATINAAHAAGCADRVGSLEPGKAADFIVLNASDYRELPYYFGVNNVHTTVKRGEILYQTGAAAVP